MDSNSKYAVVDMETTGTDLRRDDRIIQFSVSFVQNGKISSTFSTYVNDGVAIPREITELTGIDQTTIKTAPSFDQLAPQIYQMLRGTVFVAHNVNFDFPFLNHHLERVGFPSLEIEAIDTVTLSQIFFPTLTSYRLSDLSAHFQIQHQHPHSSASDADATAQLLLRIAQRMQDLPNATLQSLLALDLKLPQQTHEFIKMGAKVHPKHDHLPAGLIELEGLVLKKHHLPAAAQHNRLTKFPLSKKQKERDFAGHLEWRASQSKMMNLIYRNFADGKQPARNLLIEAPTGSGKTLGYLVPLAFLSQSGTPVVISTATISLQEQLQTVVQEQLNQDLGFHLQSLVLKSKRHYLDLSRFATAVVADDSNHLSQFSKAQILVWLTETETGDLDELHIPHNAAILQQVNYQSEPQFTDSEFGDYDFWHWQMQRLQTTDIIIVNHHYLYQNATRLTSQLTGIPYLVVDEAHHLPEVAFAAQRQEWWLGAVKANVGRVRNDIFQTHEQNLTEIVQRNRNLSANLQRLVASLTQIEEQQQQLLQNLIQSLQVRFTQQANVIGVSAAKLNQFMRQQQVELKHQEQQARRLEQLLTTINQSLGQTDGQWLASEYETFLRFNEHVHQVLQGLAQMQLFLRSVAEQQSVDGFWLRYGADHDPNNMRLELARFDTSTRLHKQIYQYFKPIIFTGAVLFTSKKSQYIYDQLDLRRNNTRMKRLAADFDYQKQVQLMIAENTPMPAVVENEEYVAFVANSIQKIYHAQPVPTLVLFNSLELIQAVYAKLHDQAGIGMVLAAGISGSQSKIIRRSEGKKAPIILGANGFWEGVDFPPNYLKSIIIPRIPFAAPDSPLMRARAHYLKQQNKNPFTSYSLPHAIIEMKQGIGRLLRRSDDHGIITILDNRILTKRYGKQILTALEENLTAKTGSITEIQQQQKEFLLKYNQRK
ncbi:helicase C-terminal domain-containing protein [Fructilactobacillus cliffordii]|uniref:3'-5' exonuclease DinG n=1 Tax=Fructilactobacillus cliffordii TaxID=2940299 RepID=A0A9Q9E2L5_9LACO|nr:helicase C-terminal domain-containing protein [Fructilactobacillus cliffordii]USS89915.1 exonuclease domain-containing protein [Fructilactobacillus cliffordii]